MPRVSDNLGTVLPANTVPDRITERIGAAETAIDALEVTAAVITTVGADNTVLTSDGTDFGWEVLPA